MTEITPLSHQQISDSITLDDSKGKNNKEIIIPLVSDKDSIDIKRREEEDKKFIEQLNQKLKAAVERLEDARIIKQTENIITKLVKEKNGTLSKEDTKYWAELINNNSKEAGISPALLAAVIARETFFEKHRSTPTGAGPMQITTITVRDMFSDTNGGRKKLYDLIDKETMNQILYQTDSEGKPVTDKNGHPVRRFNSAAEVRQASGKNDDLGIKVGIMCLKMKFAESVARSKRLPLEKTIRGLKSGEIKLSEKELKLLLITTLKNYNSVFNTYGTAVVDSLQHVSNSSIDSLNLYNNPEKDN